MSEHDPHCPQSAPPSMTTALCFCALIAKVREDERRRTYNWPEYQTQRDADAYAAALRDAVEAVKAAYMKDGPAVRSQTEWGVEVSIAAIEALGENP